MLRPRPMNRLRFVSNCTSPSAASASSNQAVESPVLRFIGAAWPAAGQNRTLARPKLRLDEQLGKRRVIGVRLAAGECELDVAGELDPPRPAAAIREPAATQLEIVLRSNANGKPALDLAVQADDFGDGTVESELVGVRCDARRLVAGRPDELIVEIAQIEVKPVAIAGRVCRPARHVEAAKLRNAASHSGERHAVSAVGEPRLLRA